MVLQFLQKELQGSAVNKSDYLLKNSILVAGPQITSHANYTQPIENSSTNDQIEVHSIGKHINDPENPISHI